MNLRSGIVFLCTLLIMSVNVYAQPSEGDVQNHVTDKDKTWGWHMFLGADALAVGQNDFKTNVGVLGGITFEKYLTRKLHIGIEIIPFHYRWNGFNKNSGFTYPDSMYHSKARYSSNSLEGALYFRWVSGYAFLFPDLHIDAGAGISQPYYYRYVFQDEINSYKSKTQLSGIGQQHSTYTFVRVGYRTVSVIATYRLSDIFKDDSPFLEPPLYNVGIQFEFPDFNY